MAFFALTSWLRPIPSFIAVRLLGRNTPKRLRVLQAAAWSVPLLLQGLLLASAHAQESRPAPAYAPAYAHNVLQRSQFYLPRFGAMYREKFEVLLPRYPGVRGVVVHNHGCGGMSGWDTTVAQFFFRQGFAVVTPEFVTRPGNKSGCPGGNAAQRLANAGARAREGIYSAVNPARLQARGDDIAQVIAWIKTLTPLPIILSGYSEGCRTTYHWRRDEPQVVGGVCHKQSLSAQYAHLWQWDTRLPMWSSIEDADPWASGSALHPAIGFAERFKDHPHNLTEFRYPGNSHDPLNRPGEQRSLREWLDRLIPAAPTGPAADFDYDEALPTVQEALSRRAPAP